MSIFIYCYLCHSFPVSLSLAQLIILQRNCKVLSHVGKLATG